MVATTPGEMSRGLLRRRRMRQPGSSLVGQRVGGAMVSVEDKVTTSISSIEINSRYRCCGRCQKPPIQQAAKAGNCTMIEMNLLIVGLGMTTSRTMV